MPELNILGFLRSYGGYEVLRNASTADWDSRRYPEYWTGCHPQEVVYVHPQTDLGKWYDFNVGVAWSPSWNERRKGVNSRLVIIFHLLSGAVSVFTVIKLLAISVLGRLHRWWGAARTCSCETTLTPGSRLSRPNDFVGTYAGDCSNSHCAIQSVTDISPVACWMEKFSLLFMSGARGFLSPIVWSAWPVRPARLWSEWLSTGWKIIYWTNSYFVLGDMYFFQRGLVYRTCRWLENIGRP